MSIAVKAVRGAAWSIGSTLIGRAIGTVATLVLTYFLSKSEMGQVALAHSLTLGAHYLSNLGYDRYVVAYPKSGRGVAFHVSAAHLVTGFLALAALVLLAPPLAGVFEEALVFDYLAGMAVAVVFERVGQMPEKILTREMRFSVIGILRTAGNVLFAVVAVSLAAAGWGGMSLILANVVRSGVQGLGFVAAVSWRDWIEPCRLRWETYRKLLRFGLPLSVGSLANLASREGDNLLIAGFVGPAPLGQYKLAYSLADLPAVQIGENIGDVLLPSYANMEDTGRRRNALVRSTGLLVLIVAPLAVGLGAVSETLVHALLREEWHSMAPLLAALSGMAAVRPVGWTIGVYLQSRGMTRPIMVLEFFKAGAILGGVALLVQLSVLWACIGVGVGFAVHAFFSLWIVDRYDEVPLREHLGYVVGPLLACAPMVGAVLGARYGLLDLVPGIPLALLLCAEIAAGAIAYVVSALLLAPGTSREFLRLLRDAFLRRRDQDVSA